ncbi:MAG: hypothetical protein A2X94_12905 [Bdellovibrionales bacterium GWB1_55_8]|nr:MAG: hypothetical protein A2X94_12905 [Bdellovibrionales bacterium GWB1_55_8]
MSEEEPTPPAEPKKKWAPLSILRDRFRRAPREPRLDAGAQWRNLRERLAQFDPSRTADWLNRNFQKQGASFYGKLVTIILCTYFLADVIALVAGGYIPEPPAPRIARRSGPTAKKPPLEEYQAIISRNLFNSQGLIPGEEDATTVAQDFGGPATKSTLPFNLVGTLILKNELRSIATIEDKSASIVYPVQVQDEIPSKAKILQIEPERVTFLNISSGRREYIELPELKGNAPRITLGKPSAGGPGIEKVSPTQFNISRQEVDTALSDLNSILTQARAVPHFENGLPAGYKLFQIVPGSIYSKLGLQNNDIIVGLNGEPVNDPGKAFSALNDLKGGASHIELQIKRDGRPVNMNFDVTR